MPPITQDHPMTGSKLTPKQATFVKEYVKNGGDGTKAALIAYDTNGENSAHSIAYSNLRKVTIKEEIEAAARSLRLTPQRILGSLDRGLDNENPMAVATSARVITEITGWKAPDRQEITHKLGSDEQQAMGNYLDA